MKDYQTHKFLKILNNEGIDYHYDDEWLVIEGDSDGCVNLYERGVLHLPNHINFICDGQESYVDLSGNDFKFLPNNIEFNNSGDVFLNECGLTSVPSGVEFNNRGDVELSLNKIKYLADGIKFNNRGTIFFNHTLESLPDNIDEFFNKLDKETKKFIKKKFPDHWFVNKERFGL